MVGAIFGHANARSTQRYAHVAHDPARLAADRATTGIAGALGRSVAAPTEGEGSVTAGDQAAPPRAAAKRRRKSLEPNPLQTRIDL